jgi:hypothetical protein
VTRSTRGTDVVDEVDDDDDDVEPGGAVEVVVGAGPARRGADSEWPEHDIASNATATDVHVAANRRGVTSRVAPAG